MPLHSSSIMFWKAEYQEYILFQFKPSLVSDKTAYQNKYYSRAWTDTSDVKSKQPMSKIFMFKGGGKVSHCKAVKITCIIKLGSAEN